MPKRDIHVVKHENGWATRKEGSKGVRSISPTQREAIDKAREQAKRERIEVIIPGRNQRIRDSDSFGNEPILRATGNIRHRNRRKGSQLSDRFLSH